VKTALTYQNSGEIANGAAHRALDFDEDVNAFQAVIRVRLAGRHKFASAFATIENAGYGSSKTRPDEEGFAEKQRRNRHVKVDSQPGKMS
jgi:hypothetical protein